MRLYIPHDCSFVHLLAPAADAAGRASSFFSLKNVLKAWLVAYIEQANAATILLTPNQATTVAGAGAKAIANARIYTNLDAAAASLFTEQAEAANYTTDAALKKKFVVFEIDPIKVMDVENNFDCVRISTGASNAANITSAFALVQYKHRGATPLEVLTD